VIENFTIIACNSSESEELRLGDAQIGEVEIVPERGRQTRLRQAVTLAHLGKPTIPSAGHDSASFVAFSQNPHPAIQHSKEGSSNVVQTTIPIIYSSLYCSRCASASSLVSYFTQASLNHREAFGPPLLIHYTTCRAIGWPCIFEVIAKLGLASAFSLHLIIVAIDHEPKSSRSLAQSWWPASA
jgi:hypothetical protein